MQPDSVQSALETRLTSLQPLHLQVVDESHRHSGPANSQTHFNVTVVSEQFTGQSLVARHRMVNGLLAEQLAGPVHALALHTYTPAEWFEKAGRVPHSPECAGGDKSQGRRNSG